MNISIFYKVCTFTATRYNNCHISLAILWFYKNECKAQSSYLHTNYQMSFSISATTLRFGSKCIEANILVRLYGHRHSSLF